MPGSASSSESHVRGAAAPGRARESLARLTARQRECLRLVPGRSSKQIAQVLGITHHAVDKHIKVAMRTLDLSSRNAAAAMLLSSEGYQNWVSPTEPLPGRPAPRHVAIDEDDADMLDPGISAVREERLAYSAVAPLPWALDDLLTASQRAGRNGLSPLSRVAVTMVLLIFIVAAIGFFVIAAEGLGRIFWSTSL